MLRLAHIIRDTARAAAQILRDHWDFDDGSLTYHRASANFVYRFTFQGEARFLRLSPIEEREESQLRAELDFLGYLRGQGYPAAYPIATRNGHGLERTGDPETGYFGVVFEAAQGEPLRVEKMREEHFVLWGCSLARLHLLSQDYRPASKRLSYQDYMSLLLDAFRDWGESSALRESRELARQLARFTPNSEDYGLIHGDFQYDNIFWNDKARTFWAIDFDDAHYHYYLMDIAYALADLPGRENEASWREAFLHGYDSVKQLPVGYAKHMSLFDRYGRVVKFYRIVRSLEGSDTISEPPWLLGLRERLQAMGRDLRQSFDAGS